MESILKGIRCMPSRRSLKFIPGPHARHFLAFDSAISKEERLIFFMELFIFYKQFVDPDVAPGYALADYLPEDLVEVRVITDPRHPAYRQSGLFAKRTIPNNTIVTSYAGFIEVFSTSCNSRTYTMGFGTINDDYALDAEFVGNYGRFANDPRSVEGCSANLTAESRFNARGEPFTALVARRQINEGEEILMAYGKAHSLSPSPWVNPRGEPLLQYRCGGIVPFPNLMPLEEGHGGSADAFPDGKNAKTADNSACNLPLDGSVSASVSASDDVSAAYHITWECTQCGAWNICSSASMLKVEYCSYCSTPKLSGAKLVSVLTIPPITPESLAAESGIPIPSGMDSIFPPERNISPYLHPDANSSSAYQSTILPLQTPAAASLASNPTNPKKRGRPPSDYTAASAQLNSSLGGSFHLSSPSSGGCVSPSNHSTGYSSVRVDWPMNIPFLPWQVWDNVISMAALGKYSRFVPHEHVFLYNVNSHEEHDAGDAPRDACFDPDESTPTAEGFAAPHEGRRAGSRGPRARGRPKALSARKQRARPPGRFTVGKPSGCSIRYGWAATPAMGGEGATPAPPPPSDRGAPEGRAPLFSRHLLQAHPSVEGFALLHTRRPRRGPEDGGAAGPWQTPFEATRRLLLNMTRRQFSGKTFQPGELVGYMGGCLCPIDDARCRPGESPLRIPMRYLVPRRWRLVRGRRTTTAGSPDAEVVVEAAADDFLRQLSSLCLVVTNDMMYCPCLALADSEDDEDEERGNREDEGGREKDGDRTPLEPDPVLLEEADALLKLCNIALVLTMDVLGSPFVGLVATRAIAAFEPLMARTQ